MPTTKIMLPSVQSLHENAVTLQNNLISLTGKVFPRMNELFPSPNYADDSQKWIDYVMIYWHCECISLVSKATLAVMHTEMDHLVRQILTYETVQAMYGYGRKGSAAADSRNWRCPSLSPLQFHRELHRYRSSGG